MYKVKKRIEVAGAHCLNLPYASKCKNQHGHNWWVEVTVVGNCLSSYGMLIDFTIIKDIVMRLDHAYINEVVGDLNPTAENIAKWICDKLQDEINKSWLDDENILETAPVVAEVTVEESKGNTACYQR